MVIVSPQDLGLWDPLQMAYTWLINGGPILTTYPSPGMILQVGGKTEVTRDHTVDGQNQENPGWYKTHCKRVGIYHINWCRIFHPPTFRKTALAVNLHQLCLKKKIPAMFSRYLLLHFFAIHTIHISIVCISTTENLVFPTDRDIQPLAFSISSTPRIDGWNPAPVYR